MCDWDEVDPEKSGFCQTESIVALLQAFQNLTSVKDFVCVFSMNQLSFSPFFTAIAQVKDLSQPVQLIWNKQNISDHGGKKFIHNHENVFLVFFGNRLKMPWNFSRFVHKFCCR